MSAHDSSTHDGSKDVVVHTSDTLPERFSNPGHPEHHLRRSDQDPRANKRAELQVVVLFLISVIGTIGFLVAYFTVTPAGTPSSIRNSNLLLGLGLFFGLMGIGLAAVHWAKSLMNDHEKSEERHELRSPEPVRAQAVEVIQEGVADSAIGRRGILKGAMVSALALFPLSIAVPLIGNIGGNWNVSTLKHTMWKKGTRLTIDPTGRPVKASDLTIGSVFHIIPDGLDKTADPMEEKAKAIVLLIRLDPRDLKIAPDREGWSYDGIIAYSKICTHVGCPVALYEQQTHHLLCPCHQSTFDVADGAKVVFGPAKRPLPQLPITVDSEGYLVAQSDFHEPVGPSFWERLK